MTEVDHLVRAAAHNPGDAAILGALADALAEAGDPREDVVRKILAAGMPNYDNSFYDRLHRLDDGARHFTRTDDGNGHIHWLDTSISNHYDGPRLHLQLTHEDEGSSMLARWKTAAYTVPVDPDDAHVLARRISAHHGGNFGDDVGNLLWPLPVPEVPDVLLPDDDVPPVPDPYDDLPPPNPVHYARDYERAMTKS